MGKKIVLIDDFDGSEIADDTQPVRLNINGDGWNVYLSEENFDKFQKAVYPFIKNAEPAGRYDVSVSKSRGRSNKASGSAIDTHGADTKDVRAWAVKNNIKNDNGKPVGDRGRLSQSVYDAYKDANA